MRSRFLDSATTALGSRRIRSWGRPLAQRAGYLKIDASGVRKPRNHSFRGRRTTQGASRELYGALCARTATCRKCDAQGFLASLCTRTIASRSPATGIEQDDARYLFCCRSNSNAISFFGFRCSSRSSDRDALFGAAGTEMDLGERDVGGSRTGRSRQHALEQADGGVRLPLRDKHERQVVRRFAVVCAAAQAPRENTAPRDPCLPLVPSAVPDCSGLRESRAAARALFHRERALRRRDL